MNFPPPTPQQARIIWLALTGLAVAALAALLVALIWGLGQVLHVLAPVLWPIAVAGVLAYLLDPVVDVLQRARLPRPRAILCVFGLAMALLLALFGSVVPQMIKETGQLAEKIPAYTARLQHRVEGWVTRPPALLQKLLGVKPAVASPATNDLLVVTNTETMTLTTNVQSLPTTDTNTVALWTRALDKQTLQSATSWLAKVAPKVGSWLFGQALKVASWFGVLAGLALIPVYAFYFLLEKRGIESKWTDYLPVTHSTFKDELVFVLRSINDYLIVFFRGQVLVAMCDGVLYAVGFSLVGIPYAVLLGVVAVFLTIIPFLGAIVTCATALVLALAQYGDWKHPLLVLLVFGVVQAIEGYVIQPKIIGDRVGLHPVTIIIALMVGTTLLGGILGGILAIPLTAALRVVMFRYVWRKPAAGEERAPGG
jgi:predicted PurR-regulated permease PerM